MLSDKFETLRIEAFSDAVFAIAITLLVLDIKVPHDGSSGGLSRSLLHLWPSYLAFLTSFCTIGMMWINHHRLFTLIQTADETLIAINMVLLLFISWVPFPTAVLAAISGTRRSGVPLSCMAARSSSSRSSSMCCGGMACDAGMCRTKAGPPIPLLGNMPKGRCSTPSCFSWDSSMERPA